MSYDNDNIFAKILRGELPCIEVYQDEHTLAFMDIMPMSDGHTLVIPKEPAETLLDLSEQAAEKLITRVQKVAQAVKQGMQASGTTIFQLNGADAGQTVPHIHFHIVPGSILAGLSHNDAQQKGMADQQQLQQFADRIKACL